MKQHNPLISADPEIMGGTPCFIATRVPVQNLFDYLEAGSNVDEFLEDFPTVERPMVIAILESAKNKILGNVA